MPMRYVAAPKTTIAILVFGRRLIKHFLQPRSKRIGHSKEFLKMSYAKHRPLLRVCDATLPKFLTSVVSKTT